MKDIDPVSAHQLCENNREKLKNAQVCGCFYCLRIFDAKEIIWEDGADQTAMCPYCGIDAVLRGERNSPDHQAVSQEDA